MSELEDLAAEVRAIAAEAQKMAGLLARQKRSIEHLAHRAAQSTADSADARSRAVLASMDVAMRRVNESARQLDNVSRQGKKYASWLARGGGSGGTPESQNDSGNTSDSPSESVARGLLSSGFDVSGGIAFFAADDKTRQAAMRLPAFPGTRKYDLHGSATNVLINGQRLSAREFADVVRADAGWKNLPITLFACDTGNAEGGGTPFAQQLANELSVEVHAPTQLAWSNGAPFSSSGHRDSHGDLLPTYPHDGEFKAFKPQP